MRLKFWKKKPKGTKTWFSKCNQVVLAPSQHVIYYDDIMAYAELVLKRFTEVNIIVDKDKNQYIFFEGIVFVCMSGNDNEKGTYQV